MSRSALWRQEGAKKQREEQAEELFQLAVEEGRNNRAKNVLPLWGPDDSFHINSMLLNNIIKSSYFQKCCRDITDWSALVDEIYYQVKHLEPWAIGGNREPSAAFCLLLRLLTLRCTSNQMELLLNHPDSPYIRGIGFLYLRYAGDPGTVFRFIEPYLYDDEPIDVGANASKKNHRGRREPDTIGDFVRKIFSQRDYYGTMLPRLPIQIERDIQVNLLLAEKIQDRAKKHLENRDTMNHFKKIGSKVMALYGDEDNPTTWYEAVVDRVLTRNEETAQNYKIPRFIVTFTEYGNTEKVTLGEMEMLGVPLDAVGASDLRDGYDGGQDRDRYGESRRYNYNHGRKNDNYGRSSGGSRYGGKSDLYEEVRKRERENVTVGRSNAAQRRPTSKKASESSHQSTSSRGFKDPSDGNNTQLGSSRGVERKSPPPAVSNEAGLPKKRSADEIAAIQEKKRKLMAKYG